MHTRAILAAIVAVLVSTGCKKGVVESQEEAAEQLKGLPYAVPLFLPAKFDFAADQGSGFGDKYRWYGWNFKSDKPLAEIARYYDQKLPSAEKDQNKFDDEPAPHLFSYTYKPDGAQDPDERITIVAQTSEGGSRITIAWSASDDRLPKK
jgi:hypothetical protein